MIAPDVLRFVRSALPPTPTRVLEIGAGGGELAGALREDGYDVVAIDPASETPAVRAVALGDLEEPPASFDAAVAIVSLHHVEPLAASCRHLAGLVRAGGTLVVDEFDVERLDERAAGWWMAQRAAAGEEDHASGPAALVGDMRAHIHPVSRLAAELSAHFTVGEAVPGPYLHRWNLDPGLRPVEERLIAAGAIPATGARFVARRS